MAFSGRVVFVAGGCGIVGSGIAQAFLQQGAKVAVNSRSAERLEEFKKKVPADAQNRLFLIQDDVTDEEGAAKIRDQLVREHGTVHHVVSSVGSFFQGGPLTKQSLEVFNAQMKGLATSHFLMAKAFLPYLAEVPGSTYTLLSGRAGERCFMKDISLSTVFASCVFGISLAAQAEFEGNPNVAIHELRMGMLIQDKLDSTFEGHETRCGNDFLGQLAVSIVKGRERGILKVNYRKEALELIAKCP